MEKVLQEIATYVALEFEEEQRLQRDLKTLKEDDLIEKRLAARVRPDSLTTHPYIAGVCTLRLSGKSQLQARVKDTVELVGGDMRVEGLVMDAEDGQQRLAFMGGIKRVRDIILHNGIVKVYFGTQTRDVCNRVADIIKSVPRDTLVHKVIEALDGRLVLNKKIPFEGNLTNILNSSNDDLNKYQSEAIMEAMTKQFSLILGPPGTGKTHTLAVLLEKIIDQGKRVLVCGQSNSAVDNLLMKVVSRGKIPTNRLLRLGGVLRTSKSVASLHYQYRPDPQNTVLLPSSPQDAIGRLSEAKAIFCTNSTCFDPLLLQSLHGARFDYTLIDEASQSPLPLSLMPLTLAENAVFAGDHHQLPPLIKSNHPDLAPLKKSIFERLVSLHQAPFPCTLLALQFRMDRIISLPSSLYFYEGKLRAASKNQSQTLRSIITGKPKVLDPETTLVWLDHNTFESKQARGISNYGEIEIVFRLLIDMIVCMELPPAAVTVITSLQAQREKLIETLQASGIPWTDRITISTVDSFQGKESEVIIYSAVRSNTEGAQGFLRDERRLNVAATRAKRLFVLVGSTDHLTDSNNFFSTIFRVAYKYGDVIKFEDTTFKYLNMKNPAPMDHNQLVAQFSDLVKIKRSLTPQPEEKVVALYKTKHKYQKQTAVITINSSRQSSQKSDANPVKTVLIPELQKPSSRASSRSPKSRPTKTTVHRAVKSQKPLLSSSQKSPPSKSAPPQERPPMAKPAKKTTSPLKVLLPLKPLTTPLLKIIFK